MIALVPLALLSRSSAFPPGWNGLAKTPPMGWRSWNAYGNRITQVMMLESASALVAKNRTVPSRADKFSLCDVGYCSVGVDEGWENCSGVDPAHGLRQHNQAGLPLIDTNSFPDTPGMVDKIHGLGLSAGWYLNGCKCGEHFERPANYVGDIKDLHDFNFDGVKIDGCGAQRNQTLYAQLMRDSGKSYTIENCHWGRCTDSDDSSCPTTDWCPFNWYRTSGDINAGVGSWLSNLQTTIKFQDYDAPLSQPGCWAYPDMLEVGRVAEPVKGAFVAWNRAHFGAWCVVSAPLIIGLALTDDKLNPILDIISNKEAIAVNQAWAGHPGMLVESIYAPPVPYNPAGATPASSAAGDFELFGGASITAANYRKDNETSGTSSLRTGGPGQTSLIVIGSGLLAPGHIIDTLSLSFRYTAGYTPAKGVTKAAPVVRVVLIERDTRAVIKTLLTTPPLGAYSWDGWKEYSPRIPMHATEINVPNEKPVSIALEVTNNQRNLQIPVDDLADGFGVKVTWAAPPADAAVPMDLPMPRRIAGTVAAVPLVDDWSKADENEDVAPTSPYHIASAAGVGGQGQLWMKPMPDGGAAALLINASPHNLSHPLNLTKLNLTKGVWKGYTVRDVWARADAGKVVSPHTTYPLNVAPFDSAFVVLSPLA